MARRHFIGKGVTMIAIALAAPAFADESSLTLGAPDCRIAEDNLRPGERATWSGGCRDGMADGDGVLEIFIDDKSAMRVVGRLRAGMPEGRLVVDSDLLHFHYEGAFVDKFFDGDGKLTQPDGTRLTAVFRKGEPEGDVDAVMPDGTRYHGQWSHQLPEGKGSALLPDGTRFTGSFHQGTPHGEGVLEVSGVTVRGVWQDGKMEGPMESFGQDGTHVTSAYRAGILDGPYRYEKPGIVVVRGQYSAGLREGRWESAEADGRVSHKVFVHDERVGPEETTPAPAASPDAPARPAN